jgi:hypothetical protein
MRRQLTAKRAATAATFATTFATDDECSCWASDDTLFLVMMVVYSGGFISGKNLRVCTSTSTGFHGSSWKLRISKRRNILIVTIDAASGGVYTAIFFLTWIQVSNGISPPRTKIDSLICTSTWISELARLNFDHFRHPS